MVFCGRRARRTVATGLNPMLKKCKPPPARAKISEVSDARAGGELLYQSTGVQPRGERCASVTQRHLSLSLKRERDIAQSRIRPEFSECVVEFRVFHIVIHFFKKVGHKRNDTMSCPHAAAWR